LEVAARSRRGEDVTLSNHRSRVLMNSETLQSLLGT
jgi:hypothetical protein